MRKYIFRGAGVLLCLALIGIAVYAQTEPQPNAWDLRLFDQPGQITLYDAPPGASTSGKPLEIGDFDGNGCADIAMTGQNARGAAGQVRIFFNLCEIGWGVILDAASPDLLPAGVQMITLYGVYAGDMLGTEIYHGDFNGDQIDDLLISAQNNDGVDLLRSNAGAAYILFGAADLPQRSIIDLAQPQMGILTILGGGAGDRLGMWVSGGDFDGDGFHDVLVGANQADGMDDSRSNAGEAYIIYGSAEISAARIIDVAEPSENITRFMGADFDDLFGSTTLGADLNQDGLDDVIISAALWRGAAGIGGLAQGGADGPGNIRYNAGDTYVIFSTPNLRGQTIDLQTLMDAEGKPTSDQISVIYGDEGGHYMGEEIAVGDLNGDGWHDLVVGSLAAPGRDNSRIDGGEAWIVYLDADFPGSVVDLAEPGAGVPVYASHSDSKGGDTMLILDYDHDGYNDLIYGTPNANALDQRRIPRPNAGVLVILYGQAGGFPTTEGMIDLLTPPPDLRLDYMLGADQYDMSTYAMSAGDLDNDGFIDLALNGMNGDGPSNGRTDAGEIYIVSGSHFLNHQAQIVTEETPIPGTNVTQTPLETATFDPGNPLTPIAPQSAQALYEETCAGCHGLQGQGIEGLGVVLVGSDYLALDDAELLAYIRTGRTADHPESKTGRAMPPSGGRPDLTNAQIFAIIAYMHTLED